jgi:hypothetical protein
MVATYYVVLPDAIDGPCFVIQTADDNSNVQETMPVEKRPGCQCNKRWQSLDQQSFGVPFSMFY